MKTGFGNITTHNPEEHVLTITEDGDWFRSCGQWGSPGPACRIGIEWITKDRIREYHCSHANAVVINI
jgi:hypothetical protein